MSWFAPAASLFKYAKHCLDPDVSSYDPQYAAQAGLNLLEPGATLLAV